MATDMEDLAELACYDARPENAVRLLGTANALRAAISAPRAKPDQASQHRLLIELRNRLERATFVRAWDAGYQSAVVPRLPVQATELRGV
jgi:hypothetical protein